MANVECIKEAVGALVAARQALRERDAGRDELESNRLELVGRQQQLSHALIDGYLRSTTGVPRPGPRNPDVLAVRERGIPDGRHPRHTAPVGGAEGP
jgi:hypothetical protein